MMRIGFRQFTMALSRNPRPGRKGHKSPAHSKRFAPTGRFISDFAGNCTFVLLSFILGQAVATAQDATPRDLHQMHKLHQDSKAYIAMLDDPQRDAYQKPHEVITALKLKECQSSRSPGSVTGIPACRGISKWPSG